MVYVKETSIYLLAGFPLSQSGPLGSVDNYEISKVTCRNVPDLRYAVDSAACIAHCNVLNVFGEDTNMAAPSTTSKPLTPPTAPCSRRCHTRRNICVLSLGIAWR